MGLSFVPMGQCFFHTAPSCDQRSHSQLDLGAGRERQTGPLGQLQIWSLDVIFGLQISSLSRCELHIAGSRGCLEGPPGVPWKLTLGAHWQGSGDGECLETLQSVIQLEPGHSGSLGMKESEPSLIGGNKTWHWGSTGTGLCFGWRVCVCSCSFI